MHVALNEGCWCLRDDLAEVVANPELEFIMARWPVVAAVAWQGYPEHGRGTVMLDKDGCVTYYPGVPCACHQCLVESYAPEQQVVTALHDGSTICSIHVVAGWPAPPDAYATTPAERLHLTAH